MKMPLKITIERPYYAIDYGSMNPTYFLCIRKRNEHKYAHPMFNKLIAKWKIPRFMNVLKNKLFDI